MTNHDPEMGHALDVDPWDVPESEEGRARLEELVGEYRASGRKVELGKTLIRLSHLCKWIGPLADSLPYALAAIEVLREADDRKALAAALRAAANPMFEVDAKAFLKEALAISQAEEDPEGEAWAIFALSRIDPEYTIDRALWLFGFAKCPAGVAACNQRQAINSPDPWHLMVQAGELYEQAGELKNASRAYVMAVSLDRRGRSPGQCEAVLLRALAVALSASDRALIFRQLTRTWKQDEAKASHYRAQEDALDNVLYGSREGRLRHEIAELEEILPTTRGTERKALLDEIETYRRELERH